MANKHLHIVCLDVPYPPDYGGVFDLFYKLRALREQGVSIHLHCFEYGRGRHNELNKYCTSVEYYTRKSFTKSFSLRVPYIVRSRANNRLLQNLSKDDYPILLEGIHCTWFLYAGLLEDRKILLRLHNVEFQYYRQLAFTEKNILKKIYLLTESILLKKYESNIANLCPIITVSEDDKITYEKIFNAKEVKYLPVFLPSGDVELNTGIGTYCLYHGNLSVSENERAVVWLIKEIFAKLSMPFVIAGKNPSKKLCLLASRYKNISISANPSQDEIAALIKNAQVHTIPSFNNTGIKIKLLNALFHGRHIITNTAGVQGTGLETFCNIANSAGDFKHTITALKEKPFDLTERDRRKGYLEKVYDNNANASRLITWIW